MSVVMRTTRLRVPESNDVAQTIGAARRLPFRLPQIGRRQGLLAENLLSFHQDFFLAAELDLVARQAQEIFFFGDQLLFAEQVDERRERFRRKLVTELAAQLLHVMPGTNGWARGNSLRLLSRPLLEPAPFSTRLVDFSPSG